MTVDQMDSVMVWQFGDRITLYGLEAFIFGAVYLFTRAQMSRHISQRDCLVGQQRIRRSCESHRALSYISHGNERFDIWQYKSSKLPHSSALTMATQRSP